MMVSSLGPNKIMISLTDEEVVMFFGGYDEINCESPKTRLALNVLLHEAIADKSFLRSCSKLLIDIKPANGGCEIILTRTEHGGTRHSAPQIYLFEFPDSESMTRAIIFLYRTRRTRKLNSYLYKMPDGFRLLVRAANFSKEARRLNEYCTRQSKSPYEVAYSEEHGRLIAAKNAVEILGRAFIRDS